MVLQTKNSLNGITSYVERFGVIQEQNLASGFNFTEARAKEFDYFKKYQHAVNLKSILEFPADGLYLNKIFPNATIDKSDLVDAGYAKFPSKLIITDFSLKNIKLADYDAIFCVTPIHHASDTQIDLFLSACHACLKPGGILIIAEVMQNSKIANFLDGFVNQYSLAKHAGNYPNRDFVEKMQFTGFVDSRFEIIKLPWVFNSEKELTDFVTLIFGLKKLKHDFLFNALNELLGIKKMNHELHLDWELIYFEGIKK